MFFLIFSLVAQFKIIGKLKFKNLNYIVDNERSVENIQYCLCLNESGSMQTKGVGIYMLGD